MKYYDNEKEIINKNTEKYRVHHKKNEILILNISSKYIIISLLFIFWLTISYILIQLKKKFTKYNNFITSQQNVNNRQNQNNHFKNLNDLSIINEAILPENQNEIIMNDYFKSKYNRSNIRYHFEDLFFNRKIFKINYSYLPYEKINKQKSYDENANYIYDLTGMLNITKLDIIYYGQNNKNFLNFNHIHLSMGHDANYILYSLPSIASILNTTNKDTFIHFHFVLLDSKFEDMKQIIQLKNIYNNVEFIFYNGKQAEYDFGGYGTKEQRGVGDYTKFLIPEIVNNTNRIIILDSADIIAKKDLSEIYYFDLDDNYFGFSLDISAGRYNKFFIFARNKFYANIGVCLVNVLMFRKDHLYMSGYFTRMAYSHMPCPTQEMFFLISRYKIKYFPLIYNCPQFFEDDYKFHNKPYNTPLIKEYLKMQKNSPFAYNLDEILEAESNQIITHLFTTKIFANKANKKNTKIWIDYTKLSNTYEKLKAKHPKTFKFYET